MIFPKEELDKHTKLNELIEEFLTFKQEFKFRERFGGKLCTIVNGLSSKLVACDVRIQLSKDHNYRNNGWVLTREGIKELFGYQGEKARTPYGHSYYDDFANSEQLMCNLIKLITHAEIQKPEALKKLITFLLEVRNLKEIQKYHAHKKTGPLQLQPQIDKKAEGLQFSCIEMGIADHWGGIGIFFTDSSKKTVQRNSYYNQEQTLYEEVIKIDGALSLTEYLQYSEEPVYSMLIAYLQENIIKCKETQLPGEQMYQDMFTKYGEYLVMSQL